ncbi:hypothetical protein SAMN06272735_6676 [Streptomyces sp. TLI_55]|uniref:hypothetical protein n=1 Tax=Streptomyces sp. TLI_55 TaxID=1938861 RepID=UPI000BD634F6|nr:hypothetical protein [Streptomyces sp. TLI_55]SNX64848.1 hypothetical protein SAMN06272735_6676 [Streptomyces sp. TLI_55]
MEHPAPEIPEVFGDKAVDGPFAEWLAMNKLALDDPELHDTGHSGGRLVSAYLRGDVGRFREGMRIIKLIAPSPDAIAEPPNHLLALKSGVPDTQDFIDRHLVDLGLDFHWKMPDGSWVMFQYPAGDGEVDTETLANLRLSPRLPRVAAEIVRQVLAGWNPTARPSEKRLTAAEFVTELLGRRLEPHGPLSSWVREWLGPEWESQAWFSLAAGSRPLPNPMFLGADSPFGTHRVRFAMRGRAHGDLHPGNIMVPVRDAASSDEFWLVDLSRFDENALLARDPLHLLMCLIADGFLPHLSGAARLELINALVRPDPRCEGQLLPQGLVALMTGVRQAMVDWGSDKQINPGWRQQQWSLALQACALMVTSRRWYPDCDRWWFYRLAAEAGAAYLESMNAKFPDSAPLLDQARLEVPAFNGRVATRLRRPVVRDGAEVPTKGAVPANVVAEPASHSTGREVLQEIWTGFSRTRKQLEGIRLSQLRSADMLAISRRATHFRQVLGEPLFLESRLGGDVAPGPLLHVRDALRSVANETAALVQVLDNNLRILALATATEMPPTFTNVVKALDDLLDAVSRAAAPQATDPIRPVGVEDVTS